MESVVVGTGSLGGRLTNHQVYATICPINLGQAPSIPGHLEYEKLNYNNSH